MRDINLLAIDNELNQPSNKIIQIGAVVGNLKTGKVLEKVSYFVNPHEELSDFIKTLTGIKQTEVDNGLTLQDAYINLIGFFKRNNCIGRGLTVQWGGGDTECLRNQLGLSSDDFFFGRRYIDAKTLFISYRLSQDLKHQAGLSKAMSKLGIQFQGKKHNAMCDAENTFKIYRELLMKFHLGGLINESN